MDLSPRQMRSKLLFSLPFAHMASAAASTAMIVLPLGTEGPVVASVIAAGPTATTYALGCGPDFPPAISDVPKAELCPSLAALTITQGPSTLAYTEMANMATDAGPPTNVKAVLRCALTGVTAAVCTNSYEGLDKVQMPMQTMDPAMMSEYQAQFEALKVPETRTLVGADMPVIGPVTITAGVEKLSGSGGGGQGKQANATVATTGSSATTAISSVSVTTNPAGGGVNTTTAKTASKASASTPSGDAGASHTSSAKASSTSKSAAAVAVSVTDGLSLLVVAIAMAVFS